MEKNIIIAVIIYLAGYFLCRKMMVIEHEAEKGEWTKGNIIVLNVLSIFSWVMVIWMLTMAWLKQITNTGYFKKPAKNK